MKLISLLFIALVSLKLLAHGEDKPGPHQGFIRMPGAFHTELLPVSDNTFKVYLLDLEWRNPSLQQAALKVRFNENGETAQCEPREEKYYFCKFSHKVKLREKGKLVVSAERAGQKGRPVIYELPLRLTETGAGHD